MRVFLACLAAASILGSRPANAEIRINGATTVTYGLIKPNKDWIEGKAGQTIAILPSSTTRGLIDLAQNNADIAMLAEPLETAAESVNRKQPGTVNVDELIGRHVGNAYVQFIVHPSIAGQATAGRPVQREDQELVFARWDEPCGSAGWRAVQFPAQDHP
jgi:hypothetical protein